MSTSNFSLLAPPSEKTLSEEELNAIYKELHNKGEIDHIPGGYLDYASKLAVGLDAASLAMATSGYGEAVSWIPELVKIAAYDIPSIFEKPSSLGRWADLGVDALGVLPLADLLTSGYKIPTSAGRVARMNKIINKYNSAVSVGRKVSKGDDLYSVLSTPVKRHVTYNKIRERVNNEKIKIPFAPATPRPVIPFSPIQQTPSDRQPFNFSPFLHIYK